jgi:hypothetical protein
MKLLLIKRASFAAIGLALCKLCTAAADGAPLEQGGKAAPHHMPEGWTLHQVSTPSGWSIGGINSSAEVFWIKLSSMSGPPENRQVDMINYSPDKQLWKSRVHMNCRGKSVYRTFNGGMQRNKDYSFREGSIWDSIAKRICPAGSY